jgi:hypothetical protein
MADARILSDLDLLPYVPESRLRLSPVGPKWLVLSGT